MWRISLQRKLQITVYSVNKNGRDDHKDGFLECIKLYNALCTMHSGETMLWKLYYNIGQVIDKLSANDIVGF